MEGEKNDLSTHLKWFRSRNRKNFDYTHQVAARENGQDSKEECSLPLSSSSSASSWLQTTLFDLDKKTQTVLKLIEEDDADSFAKRAEMYYKRRPQLIHIVQELARAHRSLAERYQLKNVSTTTTTSFYCDHPLTTTSSSSSSEDNEIKSYMASSDSSFCCSFSGENDSFSSDPDEDQRQELEAANVAASDSRNLDEDVRVLVGSKEMESLVEENKKLKEELMQKDEEKREVIRQLCFSLEFLRSKNEDLIATMMRMSNNHQNHTI